MPINVKIPTIFGILTFMGMKNTFESVKTRKVFIFQHLGFCEKLKLQAQLSWAWNKFYILGTRSKKVNIMHWIRKKMKQVLYILGTRSKKVNIMHWIRKKMKDQFFILYILIGKKRKSYIKSSLPMSPAAFFHLNNRRSQRYRPR